MKLTLASGRVVSIDDIHITWTYAGLWEGRPNEAYNRRLIQAAAHHMNGMWGPLPTHVIEPEVTQLSSFGRVYPQLPELTYHAWLTSDPIDEACHGSQAVVVWFGPAEPHTGILDIAWRAMQGLSWEQIAMDFQIACFGGLGPGTRGRYTLPSSQGATT